MSSGNLSGKFFPSLTVREIFSLTQFVMEMLKRTDPIAIAIYIDVSEKLTLLLILRHEKIDIDIAIDSVAAKTIDIAIAIENF